MTTGWHVTPPDLTTCLLCGHHGDDVGMALARYRDGTYGSIPRCKRAAECERRVRSAGGEWDIDDRRTTR